LPVWSFKNCFGFKREILTGKLPNPEIRAFGVVIFFYIIVLLHRMFFKENLFFFRTASPGDNGLICITERFRHLILALEH